MILDARNADLETIYDILTRQRARRLDLVVGSGLISAHDASIVIADTPATQVVGEDGVTRSAGLYRPTPIADEGLGMKLSIPPAYLKQLRVSRPDLYDANVNGMLQGLKDYGWPGPDGISPEPEEIYPPFGKNLLLRLLRGDDSEEGVLRAVLSPKYKVIDNLDVLLAVMAGMQEAGVNAVPGTCDLSDRRMFARFDVPEVAALAPQLLAGYRSPFDGPGGAERAGQDQPGYRFRAERGSWSPEAALRAAHAEGQGYEPGTEPVVWAGLVVSNSDTGGGARTIAPQIRVRVCKNGLTLLAEADKRIHLGSAQEEGVIEWSAETQEQELALITAQTKDAVRTFLSPDWFGAQVAAIEAKAGVVIREPEPVVREVARAAGFTKAEAEGILQHFFRGGGGTAGMVANAVTSFSQTLPSPERAAEMDARAVTVMNHAARIAVR
jgi:hypothetical protein